MCRFIAYLGKPILLSDVLYKPKNSLIQQSVHAREIDEPLNGDGFGVGWYAHHIDNIPAVFRSVQPAWNDLNLKYLSQKTLSTSFFAHVRAASSGSNVSLANCHPFRFKEWMFMHNGDIGDFIQIKRYLRRELSDEVYEWVKGNTDSEHFFALFLDEIIKQKMTFTVENVAILLPEVINKIAFIKKAHNLSSPDYINAVVTNGFSMVAVRYVSSHKYKASSLHYAIGSDFEFKNGACHVISAKPNEQKLVFISSEKLNNYQHEWQDVPENAMLLVNDELQTKIITIK